MAIHDEPAAIGTATLPERLPAGLLAWLLAAIERRRQRRALAALDDRLLADIGLTRDAACREAEKPFWRV
jgi:uncharacterized protein YjiS (DUF1127 family)